MRKKTTLNQKLGDSYSMNNKDYIRFVEKTTSSASADFDNYIARLKELNESNCNVSRLTTAASGIASEGGEFGEIVKKIVYQGKPYNEENIAHMKKELGDLLWYVSQACIALDTDLDQLISMNFEKLKARYPEGTFDVYRSENRAQGDI